MSWQRIWVIAAVLSGAAPAHAQLELVATLDGPAELVAISGDRAFVAARADLRVIDVSDPARPVETGRVSVPEGIYGIAVGPSHLYLAGGLEGMHIVEVVKGANPRLIATHPTPGQAVDVAAVGENALVVNLMTGLEVVDLSEPSHPALLVTQETPGYQRAVAAAGSLVFVVDQPSGVHVFDLERPAEPAALGNHPAAQSPARAVALAGDRAYVVYERTGLVEVLDVSDPTSPARIAPTRPAAVLNRLR